MDINIGDLISSIEDNAEILKRELCKARVTLSPEEEKQGDVYIKGYEQCLQDLLDEIY